MAKKKVKPVVVSPVIEDDGDLLSFTQDPEADAQPLDIVSQEDASKELPVGKEDVKELAPTPDADNGSVGRPIKKGDLLGYHPITGKEVYN